MENVNRDMVKIPRALLMDLARWHLLDIHEAEAEARIKHALEDKVGAMARHEAYTRKTEQNT